MPAIFDPHGEAADGRAGRQGDAETPLPHPVLRVAKDQVQLGEGQRVVDHGLRRQRGELEPCPVRRRQTDRRDGAGGAGASDHDLRRRGRRRRPHPQDGDREQRPETRRAVTDALHGPWNGRLRVWI